MKDVDETIRTELDTVTFRMPKTLHKEIKKIAHREGRSMQDIMNGQAQEYKKIHGSGNPIYPLDNWKDPNFKITPAFLADSIMWRNYIQSCNPTELNQLDEQSLSINFMVKKKIRYGDVNARTF